MKRVLSSLLLLSIIASSAYGSCGDCKCDPTGRSYLSVRPEFVSQTPELLSAFRGDREFAREGGINGAFQFVVFGSKSTNAERLAHYFFPFCKDTLLVSEAKALSNPNQYLPGDISSEDFDIITVNGDFLSEIQIAPRQSTIGFGMYYRNAFWVNEERGHAFFFSASLPVIRVKNDLEFRETVLNDGGGVDTRVDGVVANMKEAFRRPALKHGRIDCRCDMTETKVGDIELKLGYEWLQHEPCHLESYFGVVAPGGNKPDDTNLFSAVVGNGKHWGVIWGTSFGTVVWQNEEKERTLRLEYALNSQYLFQNKQCRLFDLKDRPWSRYLDMYENLEQAQLAASLIGTDPINAANLATPGANLMHLATDVNPGFSFNVTGAVVYRSPCYEGELGVNFWARQAECLKLDCFQEGFAVQRLLGGGQTNPYRNIQGDPAIEQLGGGATDFTALQFYQQNVVTEDQIDLLSASQPAVTSHIVYGSVGKRWDERKYPSILSLGASYEFSSHTNATVQRWTGWAKLGFSF